MKSPVYRLFIERNQGFENEARRTLTELTNFVGVKKLTGLRYFNRYDIEGISADELEIASSQIFSEPQGDRVHRETFPPKDGETVLAIEYLPGQYDQRADSPRPIAKTGRLGNAPRSDDRAMRPRVRAFG